MVAKGGESVDLRERFDGRGRNVLTASNATQYAFQGEDILGQAQPSLFTRFLVRLESKLTDRRYEFMFRPKTYRSSDTLVDLLTRLFSLDTGKRITVRK